MEKVIIGAGGFAREVSAQMGVNLLKFVEDEYLQVNSQHAFPLSLFNPDVHCIIIAIADPHARKRIYENLPLGTKCYHYIHNTCQILGKDVYIDTGAIICPNCILTTNIVIGFHCQLNLATTIGHDCRIGDYFTTAPGAKISGNCLIGDCVYIGTNASIREKISICSNVTIGMGSVVVNDITEPGIYVGMPARKLGE